MKRAINSEILFAMQAIHDIKTGLVTAKDKFHSAKLSSNPEGLESEIGKLGIAIALTRDLNEEQYTQLTGRRTFETDYNGAINAVVAAMFDHPGIHLAERGYRILDAATQMLERGDDL